MRKSLVAILSGVIVLCLASPAGAAILRGGVDDAVGDTKVTLGGDRLADVERVEAEYDEQLGKLTVRFKLAEALPAHYSGSVSASAAQTETAGACDYGKKTGDVVLNGWFYRSSYDGSTYANAYVEGVGIAHSSGVGSVNAARTEITVSAQGAPLANLKYRCFTNLSHGESSTAWDEDKIGVLWLGPAPAAPPPPKTSFITIPAAPSLNATSYRPGDSITATTRYVNSGNGQGVMKIGNQTIRRPGMAHHRPAIWDGDFSNKITDRVIPAGGEVWQTGAMKVPANATPGRWEVYAAWQDTDGVWHDSPSGWFTVELPPATGGNTDGGNTGGQGGRDTGGGGAGGQVPGGPGPSPGGGPTTAPPTNRPGFSVDATRRRQSLAQILRSGLRIAGTARSAGRITVTLHRGVRKVGSGAIVATGTGAYAGQVRLSAAGKRLLRRRPGAITVDARGPGGRDALNVRLIR